MQAAFGPDFDWLLKSDLTNTGFRRLYNALGTGAGPGYLRHLLNLGLRPQQHVQSIVRNSQVAHALEISARFEAMRSTGYVKGRLDALEQRVLSTWDPPKQAGHLGELAAIERWRALGKRDVRMLKEDGKSEIPDSVVDGQHVEVKTTKNLPTAKWLSGKLSHASKEDRGATRPHRSRRPNHRLGGPGGCQESRRC